MALDYTELERDLIAVRQDNEVSIIIRRGASTLGAQDVRIARRSSIGERDSLTAQEGRARVVVMGGVSFDVEPNDRFTNGGILYRVIFVRPNQRAAVMAEAEAVE